LYQATAAFRVADFLVFPFFILKVQPRTVNREP
jgi:hypothetical protein